MYQETSEPIARPKGMIIVHQRRGTAVIVAEADTHTQRMAYQTLDTYIEVTNLFARTITPVMP